MSQMTKIPFETVSQMTKLPFKTVSQQAPTKIPFVVVPQINLEVGLLIPLCLKLFLLPF